MGDLYKVLRISQSASLSEIKSAFRKLAILYHPDTSKEHNKVKAEEKFRQVSSAYETLSDTSKKLEYDRSIGNGITSRPIKRNTVWEPDRNRQPRGPIRADRFNVKMWNYEHYGDESVEKLRQTQRKNLNSSSGSGYRINVKKSGGLKQAEQEFHEVQSSLRDASESLKSKRSERLKTAKSKAAADNDGCSVS